MKWGEGTMMLPNRDDGETPSRGSIPLPNTQNTMGGKYEDPRECKGRAQTKPKLLPTTCVGSVESML